MHTSSFFSSYSDLTSRKPCSVLHVTISFNFNFICSVLVPDEKVLFDGNFSSIYSNPGPLFWRCSCTVQHSQLTVLKVGVRVQACLIAPRTQWLLKIKRWRGCNFLSSLITVKFCQLRKRQNVRPQRMFFLYSTGQMQCLRCPDRNKNSRPGCKYHCEQTML